MKRILPITVLVLAASCGGTGAGDVTTTTISVDARTIPSSIPADILNLAVTQSTIHTTICVRGYTKTIRPSVSFTDSLKSRQIASYGYADKSPSHYEEDHMIALEIGGAPSSNTNLWPEPHTISGNDDHLENNLHAKVCNGSLTLADAQAQLFSIKVSHGYDRKKSSV